MILAYRGLQPHHIQIMSDILQIREIISIAGKLFPTIPDLDLNLLLLQSVKKIDTWTFISHLQPNNFANLIR